MTEKLKLIEIKLQVEEVNKRGLANKSGDKPVFYQILEIGHKEYFEFFDLKKLVFGMKRSNFERVLRLDQVYTGTERKSFWSPTRDYKIR